MTAHRLLQDGFIAEYESLDRGDGSELIPDRQDQYIDLELGAGAETRKLLQPLGANQEITLAVGESGGGSVAITCPNNNSGTPQNINVAGNTQITLTDVGSYVTLRAILIDRVLHWRVDTSDGASLA